MIAALAFVPKGKAKEVPAKDAPNDEEIEHLKREAERTGALDDDIAMQDENSDWETDDQDDEEDETQAIERAQLAAANVGASSNAASSSHLEEAMKRLDMDNYDDDDDDNLITQMLQGGDTEFTGEDPYVTLQEFESDVADDNIKPTDLLILAAKADENADNSSTMEVWLWEEPDTEGEPGNSYVHHEIMLGAMPLSVCWMDYNIRESDEAGNFMAVSTMDPEIEIWDLDVIDAMEPVGVLGGLKDTSTSGKPAKSKSKKHTFKKGSHRDAVLCLAWNSTLKNVLASGSADCKVKTWDLAVQECKHTLKHHTDKVQALTWNPADAPVLLTGGFDRTACITDLRSTGTAVAPWKLSADIESLAWNPHSPTQFVTACEDGLVTCFDARGGAGCEPLFKLSAHDKASTSVCYNPAIPNLLATGSLDKSVKLWDVSEGEPKLLCTEDVTAGSIFSMGFPSDCPHLLAAGGSKGLVCMWDIRQRSEILRRYKRFFKGL